MPPKAPIKMNRQEIALNPNLNSIIGLFIRCHKHGTIGLRNVPGKFNLFWFPMVAVSDYESWLEKVDNLLKSIAGEDDMSQMPADGFTSPVLLNKTHVQVTRSGIWLKRPIFYVETAGGRCCLHYKILKWVTMDYMVQELKQLFLWGPEPLMFMQMFYLQRMKALQYAVRSFEEISVKEMFEAIPDPKKNQKPKGNDVLISGAKVTRDKQLILWEEFAQHCWPSTYMSYPSMCEYMIKVGWSKDLGKILRLYHSFLPYKREYLNFMDFVYGFAAFDEKVPHGGSTGQVRLGYIVRYYDEERKGGLNVKDMYMMRRDVRLFKNMDISEQSVASELYFDYVMMGLKFEDAAQTLVTANDFMYGVNNRVTNKGRLQNENKEDMGLAGTSVLCRGKDVYSTRLYSNTLGEGPAANMKCRKHSTSSYYIAAHTLNLNTWGKVESSNLIHKRMLEVIPEKAKVKSDEAFIEGNICLSVLNWIYEYAAYKDINIPGRPMRKDGIKTWHHLSEEDSTDRLNYIKVLILRCRKILLEEQRVVKVQSPCYVFGDIHGNLNDVLIFESNTWKRAPAGEATNYLFLGDYVDRGDHSLECALYLIVMKTLNPNKWFLLRGNHETRQLQRQFTFKRECLKKFGQTLGTVLWNEMNDLFDALPIAAVIDESLFCSHGGIPASTKKVAELQTIPKVMTDPELVGMAWEMMWNDPAEESEIAAIRGISGTQNSDFQRQMGGFMYNPKRGTGFFYDKSAAESFLQTNGFSHVLRGHEVSLPGIRFNFEGKVITVFSSSHYMHSTNEASCILVQNGIILPIKFES